MNLKPIGLVCGLLIGSPAAIAIAAIAFSVSLAGTANAALINFDDISVSGGITAGSSFMPSGYDGFTWSGQKWGIELDCNNNRSLKYVARFFGCRGAFRHELRVEQREF